MDVKDLIKQMITGLASGTEEGRAAADEASKQVILAKSAEIMSSTPPTANQSEE